MRSVGEPGPLWEGHSPGASPRLPLLELMSTLLLWPHLISFHIQQTEELPLNTAMLYKTSTERNIGRLSELLRLKMSLKPSFCKEFCEVLMFLRTESPPLHKHTHS